MFSAGLPADLYASARSAIGRAADDAQQTAGDYVQSQRCLAAVVAVILLK